MRILATLPWGQRLGGAEVLFQMLLDGCRQEGHELEPVFLQDGPWPAQLRRDGFRVEVVRAGRVREPHRFLATVVGLSRLMRRRQPDVVLNWMAKTQLYGGPAAALAGMSERVVWWQHLIPVGHWTDRGATLLPARAVGCCSRAAADAQRRLRPARETFVVAPGSPAPAGENEPVELDIPAGVPVVGIVGRLQPWKGQDRLLQAQALLRARGTDMHALIVGGDAYGFSSEYAAALPGLAERLGVADAVTMTGQVPDPGPYIERMDVLVNASDPEPFGIVLLEAMARGVPVLAVDSGGPSEIVENGRSGVLVPSGLPAALADGLQPLLGSAAARERLARAGRERYLQEFTDEKMRARLFAELDRVVRRGASGERPGRDGAADQAAGTAG